MMKGVHQALCAPSSSLSALSSSLSSMHIRRCVPSLHLCVPSLHPSRPCTSGGNRACASASDIRSVAHTHTHTCVVMCTPDARESAMEGRGDHDHERGGIKTCFLLTNSGSGFEPEGLGFRAVGSGFRVQGSGYIKAWAVQVLGPGLGLDFRHWGSGRRTSSLVAIGPRLRMILSSSTPCFRASAAIWISMMNLGVAG